MVAQVSVSITIRKNTHLEVAHRAKMAAVAQCLVDGVPPPWLSEIIYHFSFEVMWLYSIEQMSPPRKEMSKRLQLVQECTQKLLKCLGYPSLAGHLSVHMGTDVQVSSELSDLLRKINVSACQARKGLDKGGAGKLRLPKNVPPKFACAAVIAELWAALNNGKYPSPTNRQAQDAAHQLWNSWKVPGNGWGNDPLPGWRHYLKAIDRPDLQDLRKEVQLHCDVSSRMAACEETIAA
jgi:hypothetical protein